MPKSSPLPPTPTNRILAIGRFNASPTPDQFKLLASREVPDTLRLYLAGKIDQWYSIQNDNGVVFILNAIHSRRGPHHARSFASWTSQADDLPAHPPRPTQSSGSSPAQTG